MWDLAPVTAANGVVYASSMAKSGNEMYALDAATGDDPLGVRGRQLGQLRAGGRGRLRLLGIRLLEVGGRQRQHQALRVQHRGCGRHDPADDDDRADAGRRTARTVGTGRAVGVTVSATDDPRGSASSRPAACVDPPRVPASFADLPRRRLLAGRTSAPTGRTRSTRRARTRTTTSSPVVSATFKIDATPPTIAAAATTPPNANGWYSGRGRPLHVHRRRLRHPGRGVPSRPDAQRDRHGLLDAATVTDAAGNLSAPSNVVTVKIVNPAGLCALSVQDVQSSSRYQALRPVQKAAVNRAHPGRRLCGARRDRPGG